MWYMHVQLGPKWHDNYNNTYTKLFIFFSADGGSMVQPLSYLNMNNNYYVYVNINFVYKCFKILNFIISIYNT